MEYPPHFHGCPCCYAHKHAFQAKDVIGCSILFSEMLEIGGCLANQKEYILWKVLAYQYCFFPSTCTSVFVTFQPCLFHFKNWGEPCLCVSIHIFVLIIFCCLKFVHIQNECSHTELIDIDFHWKMKLSLFSSDIT